jgi:hypothetical protein
MQVTPMTLAERGYAGGLGDLPVTIGQTRRTLTPELVAEFEQDIQDHARV